jgi:hypothetical protein
MTIGTPTIGVLLASVIEWIDGIRPTLPSDERFLARVAAGALEVVGRELESGPRAAENERVRLAKLLGADPDGGQLREAVSVLIRAGRMTVATPGLVDALFATTLDQLAIDQPGYHVEIAGQILRAVDAAQSDTSTG